MSYISIMILLIECSGQVAERAVLDIWHVKVVIFCKCKLFFNPLKSGIPVPIHISSVDNAFNYMTWRVIVELKC